MTPLAAWRSLQPQQRRSGIAGWLGWMFDGLDMHIYTLVAIPFVALLLHTTNTSDPEVGQKAAIIQAAFLAGWAVGGGFFGIIGDRLGRSRTLVLTILTYSIFCGLSAFAQEWWQLMICRFLCAVGIGGEWAVGAALLSETLPRHWRPWIAAVLQSAVNIGVLIACVAGVLMQSLNPRWIFFVGVLPALITLWIRRAVPEPEEWHTARSKSALPRIRDLFASGQASITWRVLAICAVSLTAHWAFMFWQQGFIREHDAVRFLSAAEKNHAVAIALAIIISASIAGNFLASALAVRWGYGGAIAVLAVAYGSAMATCFAAPWSYAATLGLFGIIGLCQGMFGLFTMCLPPLFPTLLRTTGAGFCYNIGRLAAAAGTVFFGLFRKVGEPGRALLFASVLFVPAAVLAFWLPSARDEPD